MMVTPCFVSLFRSLALTYGWATSMNSKNALIIRHTAISVA
jgi:hypothetical protein